MKKLALTLSLAALLTVGAQAQTTGGNNNGGGKGILIGGLTVEQCQQNSTGILIGGVTDNQNNNGGKGILIGGVAEGCSEDKGVFDIIWDSITGILIGG